MASLARGWGGGGTRPPLQNGKITATGKEKEKYLSTLFLRTYARGRGDLNNAAGTHHTMCTSTTQYVRARPLLHTGKERGRKKKDQHGPLRSFVFPNVCVCMGTMITSLFGPVRLLAASLSIRPLSRNTLRHFYSVNAPPKTVARPPLPLPR